MTPALFPEPDKRVPSPLPPTITALRQAYRQGQLSAADVIGQAAQAAAAAPAGVWIHRLSPQALAAHLGALEGHSPDDLPLYGVPFAIKDNIELAGVETTAACPAFAYRPQSSATTVERLIRAGAIPIGKTNLDQFATGLNGTRRPYSECPNAFGEQFISGGSSSGSAVAVALGGVYFALGTDTAGSGRVPAALNNIVGLKPTRGLLPMTGVVPAVRTADTVSIFALTCADASRVLSVTAGEDPSDPLSCAPQPYWAWLTLKASDADC